MADYVMSPRQKYRLMILDALEKAMALDVQDKHKAFFKQIRNLIPLISRYLPKDAKEEMVKILAKLDKDVKAIRENSKLSSTEKEAKINELYEEAGHDLYDYVVWTITHSPIIGQDIQGSLLAGAKSVDDLTEHGKKIRSLKQEVVYFEGNNETFDD